MFNLNLMQQWQVKYILNCLKHFDIKDAFHVPVKQEKKRFNVIFFYGIRIQKKDTDDGSCKRAKSKRKLLDSEILFYNRFINKVQRERKACVAYRI